MELCVFIILIAIVCIHYGFEISSVWSKDSLDGLESTIYTLSHMFVLALIVLLYL